MFYLCEKAEKLLPFILGTFHGISVIRTCNCANKIFAVAKLALEHWSCYALKTKPMGVWGRSPQENYAQPHPIDAWKRGVTPFLVY